MSSKTSGGGGGGGCGVGSRAECDEGTQDSHACVRETLGGGKEGESGNLTLRFFPFCGCAPLLKILPFGAAGSSSNVENE